LNARAGCAEEQLLYWEDIWAPSLHALNPFDDSAVAAHLGAAGSDWMLLVGPDDVLLALSSGWPDSTEALAAITS